MPFSLRLLLFHIYGFLLFIQVECQVSQPAVNQAIVLDPQFLDLDDFSQFVDISLDDMNSNRPVDQQVSSTIATTRNIPRTLPSFVVIQSKTTTQKPWSYSRTTPTLIAPSHIQKTKGMSYYTQKPMKAVKIVGETGTIPPQTTRNRETQATISVAQTSPTLTSTPRTTSATLPSTSSSTQTSITSHREEYTSPHPTLITLSSAELMDDFETSTPMPSKDGFDSQDDQWNLWQSIPNAPKFFYSKDVVSTTKRHDIIPPTVAPKRNMTTIPTTTYSTTGRTLPRTTMTTNIPTSTTTTTTTTRATITTASTTTTVPTTTTTHRPRTTIITTIPPVATSSITIPQFLATTRKPLFFDSTTPIYRPSFDSNTLHSGESSESQRVIPKLISLEFSQIPKVTQSMEQSNTEAVWWTPKPSFVGPSEMTPKRPPSEPLQELSESIPADWAVTSITLRPQMDGKIQKAAEQAIISELEVLANTMNMKELVNDLRGKEPPLDSMDDDQIESALQTKRRTLRQLERLRELSLSKKDLELLINRQRKSLNEKQRAKGSRIIKFEEFDRRRRSKNRSESGERRTHRIVKIPPPMVPRWQPIPPPPPPSDEMVTSLVELSQLLDADSQEVDPDDITQFCQKLTCNFESGDTCGLETSFDEITKKRAKRQPDSEATTSVIRSWSNWLGRRTSFPTRIDRAPEFNQRNQRFVAALLDGNQLASLRIKVTTKSAFTIRFRGWAATPGILLRVCCDDSCAKGISGKRGWKKYTAQCPEATRTLWFECQNTGERRGACGIDDIFIQSPGCPQLFTGIDQ